MKILSAAVAASIFGIAAFTPTSQKQATQAKAIPISPAEQKIQVAILLDVSNSMDGLIEQAKAQLWNMVTVLGKAKCPNGNPKIEIALYEYGRPSNDPKAGYVKRISGFTSDLDQLSQDLFKLTTNGGDEYCGWVIHTSLDELKWDSASSNYKVIFIAGNEDFLQGTVRYSQSCDEAKRKGVIVNTIYCGDRMQGIREHWNLGGECGDGSFTNINQDARIEDIPTPYDSTLVTLNYKLNGTYLWYGNFGAANYSKQASADKANFSANQSQGIKRTKAKAYANVYSNSSWDLIDANYADSNFYKTVDMKTLPDSLKNKTREELKQIVETKNKERTVIQKQILTVGSQRENYIAAAKTKAASTNNTQTLESEVEKIIKTQVQRFNMKID